MTTTSPCRTTGEWLTDHARALGIDGTGAWQAGRGERGFWLHTRGVTYYLGKTSLNAEGPDRTADGTAVAVGHTTRPQRHRP